MTETKTYPQIGKVDCLNNRFKVRLIDVLNSSIANMQMDMDNPANEIHRRMLELYISENEKFLSRLRTIPRCEYEY